LLFHFKGVYAPIIYPYSVCTKVSVLADWSHRFQNCLILKLWSEARNKSLIDLSFFFMMIVWYWIWILVKLMGGLILEILEVYGLRICLSGGNWWICFFLYKHENRDY
jgi:hypothetical protein